MGEQIIFPYKSYRQGQKEFIEEVSSAIKSKKNLIIHAPTGLGKTVSSIYPSLKYALEKKMTVFFLTNRHSQHKIVLETLRKIKDQGLNFFSVDFIGKKLMCNQSGVELMTPRDFYDFCKDVREKEICEYYNNFKDKIKKKQKDDLVDSLLDSSPLDVINMCSSCQVEKFCSFEIAAEMAKRSDVIIADYFHLLSPIIRPGFLFRIQKELSNSIIIFDEAHNLLRRARELASESISTRTLELAKREALSYGQDDLADSLEILNNAVLDLSKMKLKNLEENLIKKEDITLSLSKSMNLEELIVNLEVVAEATREDKKRSFCGWVSGFLKVWRGPDEGFCRIISKKYFKGKENIQIDYLCLDPCVVLSPLVKEAHGVIAMSGTLTPTSMYEDLLGLKGAIKKEFVNPFPKENRLNLIVGGVTTKYEKRSKDMNDKIAFLLKDTIESIPGNSLVFFTSYDMRDQIGSRLYEITKKRIFYEIREATKEQRSKILDDFKDHLKEGGAALLGVSSGSFGEGIDLPGDLLSGVVIVGLPLTRPDIQTRELINYYDKKFSRGFEYGYVFPAFIKALQNAGRCIRSETDKGVIVFLEERYAWKDYFKYFPKDYNIRVSLNPKKEILEFFSRN